MAYPQAASLQQGGTVVKVKSVSPRLIHTGNIAPAVSTDFTNTAIVATSMFTAELFVPAPTWSTGFANFNGATATNGTLRAGIFDASGNLIAATAATASAGTDAFQRIPWANEFVSNPGVATALTGRLFLPAGTYYVGVIGSSTSDAINTHTIGNFGAGVITVVQATALATTTLTITPPTTFTTAQGCVGGLY